MQHKNVNVFLLTPVERSVIVDALLYSLPEDDFYAQELRRDALDILQHQGTLPEEEL